MDSLCFVLFLNTPNSSRPLLRLQVSASMLSPRRGLCKKKAPTLPSLRDTRHLYVLVSLLAFWLPCPETGGSQEPGLSCPSWQPDRTALLGTSGLNECIKGCLSPGSEGQGVRPPQCCHDFLAAHGGLSPELQREGLFQRQMGPQSECGGSPGP